MNLFKRYFSGAEEYNTKPPLVPTINDKIMTNIIELVDRYTIWGLLRYTLEYINNKSHEGLYSNTDPTLEVLISLVNTAEKKIRYEEVSVEEESLLNYCSAYIGTTFHITEYVEIIDTFTVGLFEVTIKNKDSIHPGVRAEIKTFFEVNPNILLTREGSIKLHLKVVGPVDQADTEELLYILDDARYDINTDSYTLETWGVMNIQTLDFLNINKKPYRVNDLDYNYHYSRDIESILTSREEGL